MAKKQTSKKTKTPKNSKKCRTINCLSDAVKYGYCLQCRESKGDKKNKNVKPQNGKSNGHSDKLNVQVNPVIVNPEFDPKDIDSALLKMTEVECLRLSALDAEVRNAIQGIRIINYELQTEEIKFSQIKQQKTIQRKNVEQILDAKKREYEKLLNHIGQKYQLDPRQMSFDTETGLLRDLRSEISTVN